MAGSSFKKLCRIAGETCVRYRLINDGDRIMVGLSGGKDSFMLMHLLEHLRRHAPVKFSLVCATFDPGFENFDLEKIAAYCQRNSWEHHAVKMDIPGLLREKSFENSPCVLCSRLRRGKLYGLASSLQCNKLALGQHLDDVINSFLMSLCRGQGLTSMAPLVKPHKEEYPAVIRPLALVPEELICQAAAEFDFPRKTGVCRYEETVKNGDRAQFKELVSKLAEKIPDLRENIAHSLTRVEIDHLLIPPSADEP
jgi:tRNA 2-thiocytidine biosynthesis protein TtcA